MVRKLLFFFPTQLFLVNLKRNHLLLLFWVLLFGIVNKSIAIKYGIPYLFLAPEYLNEVSFWSYLIMGFSIGGFVMAFNISSYVLNSMRFPFIATLQNPFLKYCINNSLFPLIFMLYYIFKVILFHIHNENSSTTEIFLFVMGIIIGYSIFIAISLSYFLSTNKSIFKAFGIDISTPRSSKKSLKSIFLQERNWFSFFKRERKWHVESYLFSPFKVKLSRDISHYDKEMLKSVFDQNHINASLFELIIFASLILLGFLGENPAFIIPAGASVILFFTMILILISALHTWLKGWTTIIFVSIFVLVNYLSKQPFFNYENRAYGLNYTTSKADYTIHRLNQLRFNEEHYHDDKRKALTILDAWKKNNVTSTVTKPKLVFVNTSGGGSRSTLWTFHVLQYADSVFDGELFNKIHLISGSSGGMVGAAYYRELYLRYKEGIGTHPMHLLESRKNAAKDLLNPIAFSIATNDFFFRLKKYQYGNQCYTKDRGYYFEKQLLHNTNNVLNKRLKDYQYPEATAQIPMMVFSPTILNDGRRMLISSQPISFLSNNIPNNNTFNYPVSENVEFQRLFEQQEANQLKFTSVIRMSATFPYIMPNVSLPSEPAISVVDAGMRDNYGAITTYKYIFTMKEWIDQNTSGIIILRIRDKAKEVEIENNPLRSITETFSTPFGSLYGNLFYIQDYNLDDMLQYLSNDIEQPIDVIDFELNNIGNDISLSWHLTTKEKERILNSIQSKKNEISFIQLKKLLNQ